MKLQQARFPAGRAAFLAFLVLAGQTCLLAAPPASKPATDVGQAPPEVASRTQIGDVVVVKLDNGIRGTVTYLCVGT